MLDLRDNFSSTCVSDYTCRKGKNLQITISVTGGRGMCRVSGKLDEEREVLRSGGPDGAFGGKTSFGDEDRWASVIVNVPPVAGMRETSPRAVEKVERSSCAY